MVSILSHRLIQISISMNLLLSQFLFQNLHVFEQQFKRKMFPFMRNLQRIMTLLLHAHSPEIQVYPPILHVQGGCFLFVLVRYNALKLCFCREQRFVSCYFNPSKTSNVFMIQPFFFCYENKGIINFAQMQIER